jgi:penicillin-binding protein 1A
MKCSSLRKNTVISIALLMISATAIVLVVVMGYYYFSYDLPSIESLKNYKPPTITRFFSDDGEVIAEFGSERREVASLGRMPEHLIQAFVAGEDSRFFQHKGLDYFAIVRALTKNLVSGEIVQGGSTITQQVVKSLLLSSERSFNRKIKEAILAHRIERNLAKEEILFLYLNQIYLGRGAYGVAAAAEAYFGKRIEELNLAESALLAGLPQAPSKYSPHSHPGQARRRQTYVLNRMVDEGFISSAESSKAALTPYEIIERDISFQEKGAHFVEYVRRYVEEKYGREALLREGLQVYTTIDLEMQKAAQEELELGLKQIEKRQRYPSTGISAKPEGALVCFELETGYLKSMVGGRDFKKSQFNRATQSRRQTGSAFKPIVYASALDKGYTPASIIIDSPIVFEWGNRKWKPRNFEGRFSGPITLRKALAQSVNVVTVKITRDLGVDYVKEYARRLGISSPLQGDLSMALGSSSLSLAELTKTYAVFANQGKAFSPIFVKRILDRDGNLLEENLPLSYPKDRPGLKQAIDPQTAYLITSLMQSVVQDGTGWRAKALNRPVAAKTGTTDQFEDAWFVGFTPELVTGVWVGFDEERTLGENETGSQAASPIWVNFMAKALRGRPVKDFPTPEGIELMKIDSRTGLISAKRDAVLECFREGSGPMQKVSSHPTATSDFFKLDLNLPATPR